MSNNDKLDWVQYIPDAIVAIVGGGGLAALFKQFYENQRAKAKGNVELILGGHHELTEQLREDVKYWRKSLAEAHQQIQYEQARSAALQAELEQLNKEKMEWEIRHQQTRLSLEREVERLQVRLDERDVKLAQLYRALAGNTDAPTKQLEEPNNEI